MKAIKSLLLVICLLSVFSVAAYAEGHGCDCQAQSPMQGLVSDAYGFDVPYGVTINWHLYVFIFNEQSFGSASAAASVQYGSGDYKSLSLALSGFAFQSREDSGTLITSFINLRCSAQVYSGTGGGAEAQAGVSW